MNREAYKERCRVRWSREAYRDAMHNWCDFQELHATLEKHLREFVENPMLKYGEDKFYNPDGTLSSFLYHLQTVIQPDRSYLSPLLDFEEHYQTVFLRRGLVFYCEQILDDIRIGKTPAVETNQQQLAI